MRRRVTDARVGRLATVTRSGRPHVVPCCFVLTGDVLYSAIDAKPKTTLALRRLDNLRANPHASLLVDHYDDDWSRLWWVRVDGDVRVLETGEERETAIGLLADKYGQYAADTPPGAVIAVGLTRWVSWP
ncbi:MAG: TIGR03668 family PPOX class F420-dependent oxidoreductase [Acidimicrobiales bacterium]